MTEAVGTAALFTAFISVGVLLATKFKCMYDNGSCKCGVTESPIIDSQEVDVKSVRANGHDFIYVSKSHRDEDEMSELETVSIRPNPTNGNLFID